SSRCCRLGGHRQEHDVGRCQRGRSALDPPSGSRAHPDRRVPTHLRRRDGGVMQQRNLSPRPLSHIETRRQRWLYQDLIPLGASTIVAGRGGIGKSTILAWLAASATRGTLPGDLNGEPIAVAF